MIKKLVTVREQYCDIDYLTLAEAIDRLKAFQDKFHPDAEIDYNCNGEYDTTFSLCWQREETDEEYIRRLDQEHLAEVTAREARKAQYERLKKEFENG